eukprot:scaffold28853_cov45-Phaeocystis_antarctica.AAC.1
MDMDMGGSAHAWVGSAHAVTGSAHAWAGRRAVHMHGAMRTHVCVWGGRRRSTARLRQRRVAWPSLEQHRVKEAERRLERVDAAARILPPPILALALAL